MTRAGGKIPFPMPSSGVSEDKHPFAVGTSGLIKSQNWLLVDGRLRTRDGLVSLDPPKRWFEKLSIGANLIPDGLAEGSAAGLAMFTTEPGVGVTLGTATPIVGEAQYTATLSGSVEADVTIDPIDAEPGLHYTFWMLVDEDWQDGDAVMEFTNSSDVTIEQVSFEADAVNQGVAIASSIAPPQTDGVRLRVSPGDGHPVTFGPMKLVQAEEVVAWSRGAGYAITIEDSLFDVEVAHPETTASALNLWEPMNGREQIESVQGVNTLGLFDGYTTQPILGRSVGFSASTLRQFPGIYDTVGMELLAAGRYAAVANVYHKMSVSARFDLEIEPINDIQYVVEAVCYKADGTEIKSFTVVTASTPATGDATVNDVGTPERDDVQFKTPYQTAFIGVRAKCTYSTSGREQVYTEEGGGIISNELDAVTIEGENKIFKRCGVIIDDIKLVETVGASTDWYDFVMPTIVHDGPYERGEYPLNYLLHNYLFEGAAEPDRILQATNESLWKFNDDDDDWEWIGFDLETIYSAFYQVLTDDDDEESFTLSEQVVFQQTSNEGYTLTNPGDEEGLIIEIELPAASESSTEPYPGGWWRYRVNGGDWSAQFSLSSEPPVKESVINYNGRDLSAKIVLDVTNHEDFADICVTPEDETLDNPIFRGTIYARHHDGETGETLFSADRGNPVDMRGYDYAQKTYVVCANPNDRVVAWGGQDGEKVERAGTNAPFARTICISGGRVMAGNVHFTDPGAELVAPLAVVYTDTFLSQGFNRWHPELAIRLADTSGEIVKLLEMGTLAVSCYKTDALYMLVFQTGNNPFRAQLMASNIPGPLGVRAVTPTTENSHLYLAEDGGIYMFDGSYPRQLNPTISSTIESEIDLNYKNRAWVTYTPRLNAALAMYPTKGSGGKVNRGMYIDIPGEAGWPFEWNGSIFDFSAGAPVRNTQTYKVSGMRIRIGGVTTAIAGGTSLQPDFFMGAADGTTYVLDDGAGDDWGEPILAVLRTGLTEFGLLDRFSILKQIEFIFNRTNQPHSMEVDVWASDYGTDARVVDSQEIDIFADGPYEIEVREKARYWGYGLKVPATEQIVYSGAYGSVARAGWRKL